jgi:hypothetical protein
MRAPCRFWGLVEGRAMTFTPHVIDTPSNAFPAVSTVFGHCLPDGGVSRHPSRDALADSGMEADT